MKYNDIFEKYGYNVRNKSKIKTNQSLSWEEMYNLAKAYYKYLL